MNEKNREKRHALPGKLRGSYAIILHTRQAQRLFRGRRKTDDKPGIIGLTAFSAIMTRIWEAAALDDPYADGFLLQAEQAIEEARKGIHARQQEVDRVLQSRERVKIEVASSLEPVEMPLNFPTPYGYMAMAGLSHTSRIIRRAFLTPARYKLLGITRKDITMTTQRGAQAIHQMGELPVEIIKGDLRSRFAPPIRSVDDAVVKVDLLDDEEEELESTDLESTDPAAPRIDDGEPSTEVTVYGGSSS